MAAWVAPLIGGGLDLIGGLLGKRGGGTQRKDAWEMAQWQLTQTRQMRDEQWKRDDAHYARDAKVNANRFVDLRAAAEKGGFNPLTALGSGLAGGGGFSGSGGGQMASLAVGGVAPPLTSGSLLSGGGAQMLGEGLAGLFDQEKAKRTHQNDLAALQMDKLRSGVIAVGPSASATVGKGLPVLGRRAATVLRTENRTAKGARYVANPSDRLADPVLLEPRAGGGLAVPDIRLDRGADVFVAGRQVKAAPGWSPGEVFEQNYSDMGGSVIGLAKLAADLNYTFGPRPQTFGRPLTVDDIEYPPMPSPEYPRPPDTSNPWKKLARKLRKYRPTLVSPY